MAAIYSGIHLKLKSPHTPWEDRLKLARFAWISSQCLMPNKEQVLLDWVTHALAGWHSKKVEFSQDVLEGLWRYLDDVLHSRKLQAFLKQGKTITLRLSIAQLLVDHLQESAHGRPPISVSTLLSVCQGVLSSPALSSVFTTKYDLMVNLLAKFCLLACYDMQKPNITEQQVTVTFTSPSDQPEKPQRHSLSTHLFEVLLQVLSCYLSVQRQQANPNRVFTVVTNHLVQPLVLLRHLLTSQESVSSNVHQLVRQQLRKDIRTKVDSILQLALFPSEHLTSYKAELFPSREDAGKRGSAVTKGPLKPVNALLCKLTSPDYCDSSLHYSVKSDALSLLLKFFLESYGKGKGEREEEQRMLCFYFLVRLVPALGLNPEGDSVKPTVAQPQDSSIPEQKSPPASLCSPESWNTALKALESLLNQALSADIYNVAADRIRHQEVQFNFYRALRQILFNEAQPSIPAWYRCLKVLLNLNHLILEPDLDQLLSSSWVNAEDMEAQVQRARQLLVCSLLQTYTKLRQLPHLFSVLLSVICQPALDDRRPRLLSEGVAASLRTCLLDSPPSQVLDICSSALKSIKTYILPDLGKEEGEEEEMEIDGQHEGQRREDASLKLFSLSQLLHVVLFSLKTLENASPILLVRRSTGFMEEMQQTVKDLLHLLPPEPTSLKQNVCSVQKTPRKGKKKLDPDGSKKVSELKVEAHWEQKTLEAALLLRYTWVEVDTLFHIYCSKYTSVDSYLTPPATETEASSTSPVLSHIESLVSGAVLPTCFRHPPSRSPMSSLLLRLLTLQQMKKVLLDDALLHESCTAALLKRAVEFILARSELEARLDEEQVWDGQMTSVNASSILVAHWYVVTSNLPLIVPYMSEEGIGHIAHVLVSSLLIKQKEKSKNQPPVCLTLPLISSQLIQSPVLVEMPSLFSATVRSLTQRIVDILKEEHALTVRPKFLGVHKEETRTIPSGMTAAVVEDILEFSKTEAEHVPLTDRQTKELGNLFQLLTNINPDGMNSEDFSSIFLLLFFVFTSTSRKLEPPECGGDALFLGQLLQVLSHLMEGRSFPSVLKLIHSGTLLQTAVSSLLNHGAKPQASCSTDWLDLVKATQGFIQSLVQLTIVRNSSVRLNLDQFASYLTSDEMSSRYIASSSSGASLPSIHLLLGSLTSFSQAMTDHLGRSKLMDKTLTQMLTRTTAALAPALECVLKLLASCEAGAEPAELPSQAFVMEVITVMLDCELASLSVDDESKESGTQLVLTHKTIYRAFYQQILREVSSAPRPMDSLGSSLHFLSAFYTLLEKTMEPGKDKEGVNELDEVYVQILQRVHTLLAAPWLSSADVGELEPAVQQLLHHLVEKCTTSRFNLLLLMIKEGLDISKLRAGNYREVLSAVITVKLLSCCQLPEGCSKALWFMTPQIISAMVSLVRSSSQDSSLSLTFTVPTVTSMTWLLRNGEGFFTNPHHVILILGALQSLPLDRLSPPDYHTVFLAVHEALFAIIQCQTQVLLKAAPSFLNVLHRLVVSIMLEGRQRGDSDSGADADVYLQCSGLIKRMYSHIAATAESFTALSAFMVAQYVTELQKVTLRPEVKLNLTEGIYCILDLCMEQDIKFLKAGLHVGVREVFNDLYSSYTNYHTTQRQGEDKYTV
ncbi:unhealthy ribosome biogenesis protein 2 homolog [Cololabis saira]|uniref:unhealthy ribosome biogenesis protein 2 homolog n=1 Tax=Cololabis saira TaxID=129043 RepID=UPI002AD1E833|nr:unhealthy ribosome biogenesis protein 2 homolog [Cololabis saira]